MTHSLWRSLFVEAMRDGDEELQKTLSQVKASVAKRGFKYCPDCGEPKSRNCVRCQVCSVMHRKTKLIQGPPGIKPRIGRPPKKELAIVP